MSPILVRHNAVGVTERTPNESPRVRGLDSIRFICAFWVFLGHDASPALPTPFADGSKLSLICRIFYGSLWPGPAAVIVFFVISGFCIHFPFAASARRPRLKEFYARRFLRLLGPILFATPLSGMVGVELSLFQESILWSLIAELIYYMIYPALRAAQLRLGSWRGLVIIAFVASLAVAATNYSATDYPSYGRSLTWLLGLPCWLLGCVIAEFARVDSTLEAKPARVWVWRAAVFMAAWFCSFLRFHSPLGYPWTLNFFAVLVTLWLRREIVYRRRVAPWRFLEWAGLWSYSLYLMHLAATAYFAKLFPLLPGGTLHWAFLVLFVLAASYTFYLLIERPSHMIARKIARTFRSPGNTIVAATVP